MDLELYHGEIVPVQEQKNPLRPETGGADEGTDLAVLLPEKSGENRKFTL